MASPHELNDARPHEGRYADKAPTFQGTGDLDVPDGPVVPRNRPMSQVMRLPARTAKNVTLVPLGEIPPKVIEALLDWLCATTEERVERWGASSEEAIAERMGLPMPTLVRFLRSPGARDVAHSAAQARALAALPDTIKGAIRDAQMGDSRQRMNAREFIRRNAAEAAQILNQSNTIQSWNPEDDERIVDRLKEIAVDIIHEVAEAADEPGEGES